MKETTKRQSKRKGKWILILIGVVIGIIFGWYLVVRLLSPWNAVKVITLNEAQKSKQTSKIQELRVGCYNIASGRGGTFGAMNWEGGDRAAKIERVKQMGHLLKEAQLDIVVLNHLLPIF